jgi:hypothetical protein
VSDGRLTVISLDGVEAQGRIRVSEEAAGNIRQRAQRILHRNHGQAPAECDAGAAGTHDRDSPAGHCLVEPGEYRPGGSDIKEDAPRHHLPGVGGEASDGTIQRANRRDALLRCEEVAQSRAPSSGPRGRRR